MSTRYVARRVDGSWQVLDSQYNDFVMGEYGAGSSGYKQARVVADSLNQQQSPPAMRLAMLTTSEEPTPTPTPTAHGALRSPAGLRAWRRAHKLSQQQLARMLEVHTQSVSRWETGEVPMPRTTELALLYLDHTLSLTATAAV